nr:N-acetylmuramoyl-L-alanine amidase [Acholeplasma laidlawii]
MTSLTISNPIEEMIKGDTYDLVVDIAPTDAYNKLLLFTSSDVKVMSVSPEGTLTALNAGIAVITVTNHNGEIMTTMEVTVHPMDDVTLEFSSGFNGFINVGEEFTMTAVGVGKENEGKTFTYVPEEDGIVELIGTNTFKALLPGTTLIDIFNGAELIYTYTVVVQGALDAEDRMDQLLDLLGNANNAVVNGLNVITYYTSGQEWSDPRYESVNLYLFDDYVVDRTTYPADPTKFSNSLMSSVEFVLVHDTANLNGGLASHGAFFANPANSIGIHYTTGDYGIVASLPDEYVGWHAGDGTSSSFQWHDTGIVATSNEKPVIDISTDGFWTFNGQKSTIQAPRGDNNAILDNSYFTYQGPTWDVVGGKYVIGTHWFAKTQQARGVIASRGGNLNSIGIEMNINTNADIIDTVQRTAKLVANLLEENNLSNNRVIMHNTTDGKGDPYTLNNTVYNGTWYFDRFMEHVAIERLVLSQFAAATITFHSDSELLSDTGRVIVMPQFTTEVQYTITVEIGGVSKSITLTSVIPGIHTWNQNYGFFKPTQAWAKADYRK